MSRDAVSRNKTASPTITESHETTPVKMSQPSTSKTDILASVRGQGVQNLLKYKYHGGDYTPLDNLLNPMWLFGANLFPRWISPNMITFAGFVLMLSGVAVSGMMFYNTWGIVEKVGR
jgi:hypothetical protein